MALRAGPIIAMFDAVGFGVAPTANFTPDSAHPLSNLGTDELFSRTRTPDLTADMQLTWHFTGLAAGQAFNVFMLAGTNATINATRRFCAAQDSGFTTGLVQSGTTLTAAFDDSLGVSSLLTYVPPWGRTLIYASTADIVSSGGGGLYVRWHQTDSANPDGYQEWAVARIGLAWQPDGGFQSAGWKAAPQIVGPPGAQRTIRGHDLTFHNLGKADAYRMQSLALAVLGGRRLLVIPEGLNTETYLSDAVWCTMTAAYVRELVGATLRYKTTLQFREVER